VRGENIPLGARLLHVALDFDSPLSTGRDEWDALARLRGQEGRYDPSAVGALEAALVGQPVGETRTVAVRELAIGMILAEDVLTQAGVLIMARGQEVTPSAKKRLVNFATPVREPIQVHLPVSAGADAEGLEDSCDPAGVGPL